MPLLLLDLDNTLLPRDAAFRAWAQDFLLERALPPADVEWLATIDGGGYVPRSTVLSAARRRYGLDESLDRLLAHYRRGINAHIHCPAHNLDALRAARAAGWTLGIVSNGNTGAQLEKIRRTGLGPMVDGWVISEEADCLKPDPLIFEIAAQRCGVAPTGDWATHTWMVGDHAPADIAGAELAGLRSVWLHHGRPWAEPGYRPTLKAAGLPEAVGQVLAARTAPSPRPAVRAGATARRGAVAGRSLASRPVVGRPGAGGARGGAVVEPDPTAQSGAHHGVQFLPSAPNGGHAPSVAHADGDASSAAAAGSAVRNRSGGFARRPDGRPGATPPPVPLPVRPSAPSVMSSTPAPDTSAPSPARAG
ncbi:HAD family hydrolase [Kitasatospora purpeofusca]|uniref:HAD family hydrolase n=1 Tax=Kitasatospora purpeofusca TaxID=67352 RepID=UPI002A5AA330|nr:HAD family hydrolase [Kitasatospora purpeofusca]MDY0810359.1 HAD family hydrolase [Kitasatospora purpeofusca]